MTETVVHIVDPDAGSRRALLEALEDTGVEMQTHQLPDSLFAEISDARPSCVVAEVMLPEMTGLDLQALLLNESPATAMLFVTASRDLATVVQAMRQGAVDVLEKPANPVALLRAFNEACTTAVTWHKLETRRKAFAARVAELVDRERQMLPYLAYGWSNKQIVAELGIAARTVEHYRRTTYEKLDVTSPLELLRQWLLLCAGTPRCLEFARHELDSPRPLPKCGNPTCTSPGGIMGPMCASHGCASQRPDVDHAVDRGLESYIRRSADTTTQRRRPLS